MGKRWFVSSALALAVASRLALAQFLDLPAHDLRWDVPGEGPRVGELVQMKAIGFNRDTKSFMVKPVEDPLEQGFQLQSHPQDGAGEGEFWFKVIPLRPGELTLPSIEILGPDGQGVARTNPFSMKVGSAISEADPNPSTPEGIRGPARLVFPEWVYWVAGLLALAILSALGWFAWRKIQAWNARRAMKPPEVPKTEDEMALIALAELEAKGFLERGEFKKHYFRLSDIVKTYLGLRYDFDAPESTAKEVILQLEDRGAVSAQQLDKLQSMFELLDRVKYTDHVPEEGEGSRLVVEARRLVTTTRKPKAVVMPNAP